MSEYVYLDYAATAPLLPEAKAAMAALLDEPASGLFTGTANPNALYTPGRRAASVLESARKTLAEALHAQRPSEILFTSGATEADNTALWALANAQAQRRKLSDKPQVIIGATEHDAVERAAESLHHQGFRVVHVMPDRSGFIEARALEALIDPNTVLVSVQLANGEVGSIQPIEVLASLAHEHGALFHTDAVQALGKIPLNVRSLGVDAATFSSHKIGGPGGIGALYLRASTPFSALIVGGGQENGRRSGTQNVVGAVGFAAAVTTVLRDLEDEAERLRGLRDYLYDHLCVYEPIEPTVEVEAGSRDFLPGLCHFLVHGYESETLVLRYDALGFAVSGGSACSAGSHEPSATLKALRIAPKDAEGALRVTLGRGTDESSLERFAAATASVLQWDASRASAHAAAPLGEEG